jgi:hypothetical protein
MPAVTDHADAHTMFDRRSRRADGLADALRLQLDACRQDSGLAAIVVSDELGFCVAHSGAGGEHEELAAQLPILADLARRGPDASAAEPSAASPAPVAVVTTFSIPGTTRLHACALTEPEGQPTIRAAVARGALARVANAFSRLLG